MQAELRGSVPKLPWSFTGTLINRAYRIVRESNLWSFQLFESSWISPPLITDGTVTLAQGSATITFDATAVAAINAAQILSPYSLITQRQFRNSAAGGIYNLIAYDNVSGVTTLDRPYADQTAGAGCGYQLYQVYYPAPYKDFLTWISVRNPSMFLDLNLTTTRAEIDAMDPQRTWYQFPSRVVPWGVDLRGLGTTTPSATLGYRLFELWGQAVTPFTYQCYGIRVGAPLVNPTDTLPPNIDEELVLAKAKHYAYEWAEANKDMSPRSSGPDFRFLMAQTDAEYIKLLTLYRKQDKEFVNNWLTTRMPTEMGRFGYFNTLAGVAGPYSQF
jgi:hypothetical protein